MAFKTNNKQGLVFVIQRSLCRIRAGHVDLLVTEANSILEHAYIEGVAVFRFARLGNQHAHQGQQGSAESGVLHVILGHIHLILEDRGTDSQQLNVVGNGSEKLFRGSVQFRKFAFGSFRRGERDECHDDTSSGFSHGNETSRVFVQYDPWLNPENHTTKSRRHEDVKNQMSLLLCVFVPWWFILLLSQ